MKNIYKEETRTLIIIFVIGAIFIFGLFGLTKLLNNSKPNQVKNEISQDYEMKLIDDYNMFFAISNDVNNFIKIVSSKNTEESLGLLNTQYINSRLINFDNIFNIINYKENSSFTAKNVYSISLENDTLYYVEGKLLYKENLLDDINKVYNDNYRILVFRDYDNLTISFYPIESDKDLEIIKSLSSINISKNEYNTNFSGAKISTNDICILYLSNFYNEILYNIEASYNMLYSSFKDSKYPKLDEYKEYINENITKFSPTVKSCEISNGSYIVYDNNENYYSFKEKTIMNYEVTFILAK